MSENTKTRKAVVTLDAVREALAEHIRTASKYGINLSGHEFDRGARGKGFAQYDASGNVVKAFETREAAIEFFTLWAEVARDLFASGAFGKATDNEQHQDDEQAASDTAVPTQTRRRVKTTA